MSIDGVDVHTAAERLVKAIRDHAAAFDTADIATLRHLTRKLRGAALDYSAAVIAAGWGIDPFDEEEVEGDFEDEAAGDRVIIDATYHLLVLDEQRLIDHTNEQLAQAGAPYEVDDAVQAVEDLYRLQLWDPGIPEFLKLVDFSHSASEDVADQ